MPRKKKETPKGRPYGKVAFLAFAIIGSYCLAGLFHPAVPFPIKLTGLGETWVTFGGTVVDTPNPAGTASGTLYAYKAQMPAISADADVVAVGTNGVFDLANNYLVGSWVYLQVHLADFYSSPITPVQVGMPAKESSEFNMGNLYIADMCTTTDITMALTDDALSTVDASNALAYTAGGLWVATTGLGSDECFGYEDYYDGRNGKWYVQRPIVVIQSNQTIPFDRAPDFEPRTINGDIYYVFIMDWYPNDSNVASDGIGAWFFGFTGNCYDGDYWVVTIYVNGDDLDTPISMQDVMSFNFGSYTACETVTIEVT